MADRTGWIAGPRPHHAEKGVEGDHIASLRKRAFGQLARAPPVTGLGGAHRMPQDIGSPRIENGCGIHFRSLSCSAVPMQSYTHVIGKNGQKRRGGWSEVRLPPLSTF